VVIKFSTPKEATMYRRKRRILKSLVLGFAVAALAAPTALAEPRGPGNSPHADFWNYDARTGEKVADTSRGAASTDLSGMYGQGSSLGPDDRAAYRGTTPQLDPAIGLSSDDRAVYRGTTPQADPVIADAIRARATAGLSPDDRAVFRGVEPTSVPVNVTVSSVSDGFQWSDAGLGAASTLALVLLMGAATVVIRHQRRRIAAF
jgi:hypothetical protein